MLIPKKINANVDELKFEGLPIALAVGKAPAKTSNCKWLKRLLCAGLVVSLNSLAFTNPLQTLFPSIHNSNTNPTTSNYTTFHQCALTNMRRTNLTFLEHAHPLPVIEFEERRDRLARALVEDGLHAYVAEPGYAFQYYANVSQKDWEVWEPEERPFLLIVRPHTDVHTGEITANTTFLVPHFEASRAELLGMPFSAPLQLVTWEEHWNPYDTLLSSSAFAGFGFAEEQSEMRGKENKTRPVLMVDDEIRDFISRGLSVAGFDVRGLGGAVERVRQTKSKREVEILRAVNTGTVEAVRQVRECLYPGLTENEVQSVLDSTLLSAGLEPFFDIVLFDENAALPHGGTPGTKTLEDETFVLIDVGAHLHGYSSDICRTFFPPFFPKPEENEVLSDEVAEKVKVWHIVFEAQARSIAAMRPGASAASIDLAARETIESAGYGEYFTHRVGHGIGIKAHESPYLHKSNSALLKAGMAFTSEPGVYVTGVFGVRHEDILLVREEGEPEVLTGKVARGPWEV